MVIHKWNQHFPSAVTDRRPLKSAVMCILHSILSGFYPTAHTVTLEEETFFGPNALCKSGAPHVAAGHFKSAN